MRRSKHKSTRPLWSRKRLWLTLAALGAVTFLPSCSGARVLMKTAPNTPKGAAASPAIEAATLEEWKAQASTLKAVFETEIYGLVPQDLSLLNHESRTFGDLYFNDTANVETQHYAIEKNGQDTGRVLNLVIVTPDAADGPVPIIMMQNFCPNHNVIPLPDIPKPHTEYFDCSGEGFMADVFGYFFGRYITTPPITEIMNRGYALAVMYPSEFVPDSKEDGQAVLDQIFSGQDAATRTGAIAAWAAEFTLTAKLLEADPRFDTQISYGHSRFGKSALLAAAFDPNIDAVIAHQSGTGGASLTKDKPGETLTDITQGYPFWFNRRFSEYAGREDDLPIDQHQLLALIAPRPLLLGNAKRDVWSDPEGAFRAAQAATPVYKLYGSDGLKQSKLTDFDPTGDIAFWMRPGTHGIVKEDWPAFLDFLDAHF